jgi:hypothetical protein
MNRASFIPALAGAVVVFGAAACDNLSGVRNEPVALTFQVPRSAASSADAALQTAAADPVTITQGGHTLRLDQVQVAFSRVDLQRADAADDKDTDRDSDHAADSDKDSDSDQRDNVHLRGPFTVDLPLQGGTITPVSVNIPLGTYDEVKLRVSTIRLVGLFDGQAFDVLVPIREKFEVDLNPPLVVDENSDPLNVTVRFVPAQWFQNDNGSLIDPRQLATDKRLRERFRARIRAALRAFKDLNRNGEDDQDTDHDR